MKDWPRITIVTPSFNQAEYLEETIRSVILQGYPNLEYFVVDGGSADESVAILEKYSRWIDWWVSERDEGQAHALNKGFSRSTGDIVAYLNSDDLYLPSALKRVAAAWQGQRTRDRFWVCFPVEDFDESGAKQSWLQRQSADLLDWITLSASLHQPGVFWSADLFRRFGPFDTGLRFAFDRALFMSFLAAGVSFTSASGPAVARFRWHNDSKSQLDSHYDVRDSPFLMEFDRIGRRMLRGLESAKRHDARAAIRKRDLYRVGLMGSRSGTKLGLRELLRAAERYPSVLSSRMFWGALRRCMSSEPR